MRTCVKPVSCNFGSKWRRSFAKLSWRHKYNFIISSSKLYRGDRRVVDRPTERSLENNCAEDPNKLYEFKRLSCRILKTVDSVYQDVSSVDECRELCLNSPYRCHSYDYGDTGDMVCRLSHHSRATLADIQDPYLDVPEAATYELSSCYNVSIECRFEKQLSAKPKTTITSETVFYAPEVTGFCVNGLGLIVAGTVFLLAQLAVIAIWTFLYQRRRKQRSIDNATYASSVPTPTLPGSQTDSLSNLYDHSFASRHGRQF